MEVGGCWAPKAGNFVRVFCTCARAASVPAILRPAAQAARQLHWSGTPAVAAQRTLAGSMPHLPRASFRQRMQWGVEPTLQKHFADVHRHEAPERNRMPDRAALRACRRCKALGA